MALWQNGCSWHFFAQSPASGTFLSFRKIVRFSMALWGNSTYWHSPKNVRKYKTITIKNFYFNSTLLRVDKSNCIQVLRMFKNKFVSQFFHSLFYLTFSVHSDSTLLQVSRPQDDSDSHQRIANFQPDPMPNKFCKCWKSLASGWYFNSNPIRPTDYPAPFHL